MDPEVFSCEALVILVAPSVPVMDTERCTVLWDSATLRWSPAKEDTPGQTYTLEYCRQYELEGEGLRFVSEEYFILRLAKSFSWKLCVRMCAAGPSLEWTSVNRVWSSSLMRITCSTSKLWMRQAPASKARLHSFLLKVKNTLMQWIQLYIKQIKSIYPHVASVAFYVLQGRGSTCWKAPPTPLWSCQRIRPPWTIYRILTKLPLIKSEFNPDELSHSFPVNSLSLELTQTKNTNIIGFKNVSKKIYLQTSNSHK